MGVDLARLAKEVERAPGASLGLFERAYHAVLPSNGLVWHRAGWAHVEHGAYLDAVVALIRERLPRWKASCDIAGVFPPAHEETYGAKFYSPSGKVLLGEGGSPALALLSATLRALASQEKADA